MSNLIAPRTELAAQPGNRHFIFVYLATPLEAENAIRELNGASWNGGYLSVRLAKDSPRKKGERRGQDFSQAQNEQRGNMSDLGSEPSS
jgi:RNA recognition motif-containing protein